MTSRSFRSGHIADLTIRDYLQILTRQRWLVAGVFGAVLAASICLTLLTPVQYESTSSVLLRTSLNTQVFPTVGQSQLSQYLRNPPGEFAYVSSTDFALLAEERIDADADVTPFYDSDADPTSLDAQIIEFRARASSPSVARTAAQAWAELYLSERVIGSSAEVDAAIDGIASQIRLLEEEKATILAPLAPIDDVLIGEDDPDTVARLTAQRVALQQTLDDELLPIRFQLRTLSDDLGRLEIARDLAGDDDLSARINTAAAPAVQVAPNPERNIVLGGFLGALLGIAAALLNDSLRVRIGTRNDLELVTGDVPLLAEIPALPEADASPEQRRRSGARYGAEVERVVSAVAYQAGQLDQRLRVMVTSAQLGEGKSTLVEQIARRLSASHMDTIILDADLRRPVLHERLGVVNRSGGLGDILAAEAEIEPHLVQVPGHDHLRLLPAGQPSENAAAVLRRSFDAAIDGIDNDGASVILVDSPPVLAVTDAEIMANSVDRLIVVVRAGVTTRTEIEHTLRRLESSRASLLGVVLVGVDQHSTSYGYGYRYGYGYGYDEPSDPFPPASPPDDGPGGGGGPGGDDPVAPDAGPSPAHVAPGLQPDRNARPRPTPAPRQIPSVPQPAAPPVPQVPERPAAAVPRELAPAMAASLPSVVTDVSADGVVPLWLSDDITIASDIARDDGDVGRFQQELLAVTSPVGTAAAATSRASARPMGGSAGSPVNGAPPARRSNGSSTTRDHGPKPDARTENTDPSRSNGTKPRARRPEGPVPSSRPNGAKPVARRQANGARPSNGSKPTTGRQKPGAPRSNGSKPDARRQKPGAPHSNGSKPDARRQNQDAPRSNGSKPTTGRQNPGAPRSNGSKPTARRPNPGAPRSNGVTPEPAPRGNAAPTRQASGSTATRGPRQAQSSAPRAAKPRPKNGSAAAAGAGSGTPGSENAADDRKRSSMTDGARVTPEPTRRGDTPDAGQPAAEAVVSIDIERADPPRLSTVEARRLAPLRNGRAGRLKTRTDTPLIDLRTVDAEVADISLRPDAPAKPTSPSPD